MDWTIITSVLGGAVGASLITAFVNWRMKIREEQHSADRWKLEKRLALYTNVTTVHRKVHDLSKRFAKAYAEFLNHKSKHEGDNAGLQKYNDHMHEIYVQLQAVMRELDIETNLSFIVASERTTDLLANYASATTLWVATSVDNLEGRATEEALKKAEEEQSDAWFDFIEGARSDLGF